MLASPALGARPVEAEFWNGDRENGAAFHTSKYSVRELQFFCQRTRYDLETNLRIRRDGTFRYDGRMRKYGESGQPLGFFKGTVKGHFTSRRQVTIRRSLENCGRTTVRATAGARG